MQSVCSAVCSVGSGQAGQQPLAEVILLASQNCLLRADGHKRRRGEKGSGPEKARLCKRTWRWPPALFIIPIVAGSRAGFLSGLLREALLIHPHENASFIHIDIINEEAGSMLYQLTPQGKVKWAFFWRVVPKLRTVTHSK